MVSKPLYLFLKRAERPKTSQRTEDGPNSPFRMEEGPKTSLRMEDGPKTSVRWGVDDPKRRYRWPQNLTQGGRWTQKVNQDGRGFQNVALTFKDGLRNLLWMEWRPKNISLDGRWSQKPIFGWSM